MPDAWWRAVQLLPISTTEAKLLTRGTKTRWDDAEHRGRLTASETLIDLDTLTEHGATPELVAAITSGKWVGLCEHATTFRAAVTRWGSEIVMRPTVRVGTIHSVKGAEADNVALLTSTTGRIAHARDVDRESADEERRARA
jgi:superfamily I DNA/RNA helicase